MIHETDFTHVTLPTLNKRVLRLGLAGNYGIDSKGVEAAAERGVNFWLWSPRFSKVTEPLKRLLSQDRDKHVVCQIGNAVFAGGPNKDVDKAQKLLGIDHVDIYLLGWLGRASRFSEAIQKTMGQLKASGAAKSIGCSIHDRPRAAGLVKDSILDTFMLRYNAKHPGNEVDVFPHLSARNPNVITYTSTSWKQLLKPIKGLEMPPWPGETSGPPPLTAAECYRFALSSPHVHVTLTGPATATQLEANMAALEAGPLSEAEMSWVREYGQQVRAKMPLSSLPHESTMF